MKKEITAWDVLDALWDFIQTDKLSEVKGMNWANTIKHIMKTENISDFSIEDGVKKFLYEKDYVFKKPNRLTMKWMWGSHAELYDIWGCEKHMFTLKTSDSYEEMIDGQTVFCPFCNKDIMPAENFNRYVKQGFIYNPEDWKRIKKTAKWHKDWDRKENFKYRINQLKDVNYLWYKIKYNIKKLFA